MNVACDQRKGQCVQSESASFHSERSKYFPLFITRYRVLLFQCREMPCESENTQCVVFKLRERGDICSKRSFRAQLTYAVCATHEYMRAPVQFGRGAKIEVCGGRGQRSECRGDTWSTWRSVQNNHFKDKGLFYFIFEATQTQESHLSGCSAISSAVTADPSYGLYRT